MDHGGASLGEDRELAGQYSRGRERAGIQLRLPDAHHIARFIQRDLDMRGTGLVCDSAVGIITENGHHVGRLSEIRIAAAVLLVERVEGVAELLVRHQNREKRHHQRGGVAAGFVGHISLQNLGGLVIDAGHKTAAVAVIDDQVIGVGADGGLVLRHGTVIDDADSPFSRAAHAFADGEDGLDDRGAERGDRPVSVGGGYRDLLVFQRVKGRREGAVKCEKIRARDAHSLIPFCSLTAL